MSDPLATRKQISRTRNALSMALFATAAALIALAVYFYIDGRNEALAPVPPSIPGRAELKNVYDAIDAANLNPSYGRETARIEGVNTVGQQLIVDDTPVFIFIFSDPESREREMARASDPVVLVDLFGTPVTGERVSVASTSNVVTATVGGGDDLITTIEQAVSTLP
ncbi:hypothetical protein BH23CHL5_BH23CHL5_10840 [soil metagenome]